MTWTTPPEKLRFWQYVRWTIAWARDETSYRLSYGDVVLQPRDDEDLIVLPTTLNDLTTSDIRVHGVVQQRLRECRRLRNVLRIELANKHVVAEQCLDVALHHRCLLKRARAVKAVERLVRRREERDVRGIGKGRD